MEKQAIRAALQRSLRQAALRPVDRRQLSGALAMHHDATAAPTQSKTREPTAEAASGCRGWLVHTCMHNPRISTLTAAHHSDGTTHRRCLVRIQHCTSPRSTSADIKGISMGYIDVWLIVAAPRSSLDILPRVDYFWWTASAGTCRNQQSPPRIVSSSTTPLAANTKHSK